ncbi:hypothetical protein [Virgibacillus oceani]|uniref:Uncharacterized protein n=1 Tax=Virgibacillus oceani TaxID=1479511 RepID=A0A917H1J3_9BACI|nr:hypothetical protein [Virgibacillus oceani]GGG64598.1 hypothetical protein GCM10011398_05260 [Virgibacillus oceani]
MNEQEKAQLKYDAAIALKNGNLDENTLNYFIEKAYHIGHNAGEVKKIERVEELTKENCRYSQTLIDIEDNLDEALELVDPDDKDDCIQISVDLIQKIWVLKGEPDNK